MNDTIARLFHQSGGNIRTVNGATWTYTDEGFDMEKFAKLIVQECANIADEHEPLNTWTKRYSTLIKEHFGVK
jgi:hypothetical protein